MEQIDLLLASRLVLKLAPKEEEEDMMMLATVEEPSFEVDILGKTYTNNTLQELKNEFIVAKTELKMYKQVYEDLLRKHNR